MKKKNSNRARWRISGLQFKRFLIALLTALMLCGIMIVSVTPARYNISVGSPAPNTIKASKDVTDTITTEAIRDEAAAKVKSIYYVDDAVEDMACGDLEQIFANLRYVSTLLSDAEGNVTEEQLDSVNTTFEGTGFALTMDSLNLINACDSETLQALGDAAVTCVMGVLDNKLGESQVEAALFQIRSELLAQGYSEELTDVAMQAVELCLKPNYFYDEAATEAARQAERDSITAVTRIKGEVIVSDGEIVTEAQYAMLDQLGLIKESTLDIYLYIGLGVIVLIVVTAASLYIKLFCPAYYASPRTLLLIAIVCVMSAGLCALAKLVNVYLMPVTLAMLLITILVHRRVALYMNLMLAIIASLLCSTSGSLFNMATYSIFISSTMGGIVAHSVLRTKQTRTGILLSGLLIGLASMLSTFAVGLIASSNMVDSAYSALYSGGAGILSAVIAVAVTPLFESIFNVVTTSRLLELSNPNHPLLRRLLLEAPGTYHHSIIVANLAEAGATAIGANSLLARVGAYYHDVGKLKRPMYFKENQLGDNPHDRTDPRVSAAIIMSHPKDGVEMLKEHRIPEAIQEIVISHHGDTPVMWFYNKAKQENDNTDIEDFRYPGPRPHSREAALVMLADTVEAAARSLKDPTAQSMHDLIEKLIYQKLSDGQLSECALTFADIGKCISAFVTVLSGAFHERIEYPKVEIPKREIEAGTEAPKE